MRRYIESVIARVEALRDLTRDYYWQLVDTPLGKWIPAPNVLAGTVAAGLVLAARELGLDALPVGWSEAVAGVLVTYFVGPPKFAGTLTLAEQYPLHRIEDARLLEELDDQVPPAAQDTGLEN